MELSRNPQPERPVCPADAGPRPHRHGRRAPSGRRLQRQAAAVGERPPVRCPCHRRLLDLPPDGKGDPPRLCRIRRIPVQGRGRRPRQVGIPRQYEPRDPHADERRARHGRTAGQDRPDPTPEDLHRRHRQIRQCAAHHHQRHPRFLQDQCRPARRSTRRPSVSPRRSRTWRRWCRRASPKRTSN